ncbi:MAG: nitrous oxide-stimulated promoter family protein [Myxococcales bacterium]|nr:nitrous oxide-stimulated promoter family protein [Myxococcales bacterium]
MRAAASRRIDREIETVRTMIGMYCAAQHGGAAGLCENCAELAAYAERRVRACRFGADKPTCQRCPVHCFRPESREAIRRVMRYAGPRMAWRHPVMALRHLLVGRREAPTLGKEGAR